MFNGPLASTHFSKSAVTFFIENVSTIKHITDSKSVGESLLEPDPYIDSYSLDPGTDAERDAIISITLKTGMTITAAYLYVSETNSVPASHTVDITSGISGSSLAWTYDVGAPNARRYYWVKLVDSNTNESISSLGSYTTEDNTEPSVGTCTLALGTPPTTSVDLTFSATDNDTVQTIYILFNDTQSTDPGAALIKTAGDAYNGTATSHTYSGLSPNTTYYAWILARDAAGNETAVYSFSPASITTNEDTTPPTVDSFTLAAGSDPESEVSITLTISDTA